jgi:hypothetical protein
VILDADEVEPRLIGRPRLLTDAIEPLGQRNYRDAESEAGLNFPGSHERS